MDSDGKTAKAVRVLLMDDEEMIRDVAGRMFKSLGYEYSLATDGEDALAQYEEAMRLDSPFQIVILDWNVRGGMGGREAAERLRSIDPGAVILASSGDTALNGNDELLARFFTGIVVKPYTMKELGNILRRYSAVEGRGGEN